MTTYTLNQLQLDGLILNCGSAVGKEMLRNLQPNTQEPSAWMQTDCIGERFLLFDEPYQPSPLKDKVDPLFTHQAPQQKPLTDEQLRKAAQAVVDRWDAPLWKDVPATADYINELRKALK